VSGTKKLFEMTQRASELNADGKMFDEIVDIIADEWNLDRSLAHSIVKSWWDGNVMRTFDWEGTI
jgi:hypothetical protein